MRRPTNAERLIAQYVDCALDGHRPDFDQPRRTCDPEVRAVTCTCGLITWTPTEENQ